MSPNDQCSSEQLEATQAMHITDAANKQTKQSNKVRADFENKTTYMVDKSNVQCIQAFML